MANFTGRNVSFHWCCPFVLVSGVRQSVRGHRHLTIKVDTWVAFKSDYCGQEVRMFPEELWDPSIVPLNYFSQSGWNLFAELLLSFRRGCAGHGAEMLQQDRACFLYMQDSASFDSLRCNRSLRSAFLLSTRFKKLLTLGNSASLTHWCENCCIKK